MVSRIKYSHIAYISSRIGTTKIIKSSRSSTNKIIKITNLAIIELKYIDGVHSGRLYQD
jgi:hypothetical protein